MQFDANAPLFGGHGTAVKYKLMDPSGSTSGAGLPASPCVHDPVKLMGTYMEGRECCCYAQAIVVMDNVSRLRTRVYGVIV